METVHRKKPLKLGGSPVKYFWVTFYAIWGIWLHKIRLF